jgi:hypothetical protein
VSRVRVSFDDDGEVEEFSLGPSRGEAAQGPSVDELLRETDPGPAKDDRYFKPVVSEDEAGRGWKAMMLAPTLEICQALLRGESVPIDQLRPEWVARFGLRPGVGLKVFPGGRA